MKFLFAARIDPDPDGGFLVSFPDVPEAITAGDTLAEARANASEALSLALRGYLAEGRALPAPATRGQAHAAIAVDAATAAKLAVIEAFRESGASKSELARRLGRADTEAHRILDPDHPTKIAALEAALAALGKRLIVSIADAA